MCTYLKNNFVYWRFPDKILFLSYFQEKTTRNLLLPKQYMSEHGFFILSYISIIKFQGLLSPSVFFWAWNRQVLKVNLATLTHVCMYFNFFKIFRKRSLFGTNYGNKNLHNLVLLNNFLMTTICRNPIKDYVNLYCACVSSKYLALSWLDHTYTLSYARRTVLGGTRKL